MAPPDNDVLWARALVKSYRPRGREDAPGSPALRGVSLGVRDGEILAVTGPRGCGKSTLLKCLSGRLLPDEGEVWFHSRPVHTLGVSGRERLRRERFGWIGAEPRLAPELTARENAALPLLLAGVSSRAARAAAQEWLERLDVADCARLRPEAMPQARRQRVAVARALVAGPTVLFADEPTAPLHDADRGQVLRVLSAVCRSHAMTIVLATGEDEVLACADRVVTMADGRLASGPPLRTLPQRGAVRPGAPRGAEAATAAVTGSKNADRCSASA